MKVFLAIVALVTVLASAGGEYVYAHHVASDLARFKAGICGLEVRSSASGKRFDRLLVVLERRAVAREHLDRANGNLTAAAADADSARLYASVLPHKGQSEAPPNLGC